MSARLATPADDTLLADIVNHPAVARWTMHDDALPFDPTSYTAHPKSFAVIVEGGCFLAAALEFQAYCVHTNLLPTCRGAQALRSANDALSFVFTRTDAEQLWTMVPDNNPQALWFSHAMGMRNTFRRDRVWTVNGVAHDMQHMRMDIDDWVMRAQGLREIGESFQEPLGAGNQDDDPVHHAYLGAAFVLIGCGLFGKASRLYSRWARAAGYAPSEILSIDPLRIDINGCVLGLQEGKLTIEEKQCQPLPQ